LNTVSLYIKTQTERKTTHTVVNPTEFCFIISSTLRAKQRVAVPVEDDRVVEMVVCPTDETALGTVDVVVGTSVPRSSLVTRPTVSTVLHVDSLTVRQLAVTWSEAEVVALTDD